MTTIVGRVSPQVKITNRSDMAYADELEAQKQAGLIHEWHYQKLTFLLAPDTRYTPDFFVVRPDGTIELHEVKGFWRDDAKVKAKLCADLFPFALKIVKARTKKEGGGWAVSQL